MATTATTTPNTATKQNIVSVQSNYDPSKYAGNITNYEGLKYLMYLLGSQVSFQMATSKSRKYTITLPHGEKVKGTNIRGLIEEVAEHLLFKAPEID